MTRRVFISYSAKGDDTALEIRDAVRAALEAAGHQVFIDEKDLPPGETWRRRIRRELAECHAGVILFTRGALGSDWVLYEASILSFVREFASTFRLMPVLLQDVRPEDLRTPRFAPLGLDEFQYTHSRVLPDVAHELVRELGTLAEQKTLLEHLVEEIELALSHISEPWLRKAALALGANPAHWRPDRGLNETAVTVARMVLGEGMPGVHKVIRTFAPELRSTRAWTLLEILAPLWVPHEDAGRILRIVHRGPPPWCVGLNGRKVGSFTAEMFVDRAYWPRKHDVFPVKGGAGEDLVGHIRDELLASVKEWRNCDSLEEADEYLRKTREPIFVTLPRPMPDAEALEQLREAYPYTTFILDTGEACPRADDLALPPRFEALPQVDLDEEDRAWIKYKDSIGDINRYP